MWLHRKTMPICFPSQRLLVFLSHLQSILILGWCGDVAGLKMGGSSLLHLTYLLHSAPWHDLCLGKWKWTRQAWLLPSGISWDKQWHQHNTVRERHASLRRPQIGAGSKCTLLWRTRMRWIWNLKDGREQRNMWGGVGSTFQAEQWDHSYGFAVCAGHRGASRSDEGHPALLCSPLVHPGA